MTFPAGVCGIIGSACIAALAGSTVWPAPPREFAEETLCIELEPHPEFCRRMLVRFRNTSHESAVVLRPLDGSTWEWYQPIYRFRVSDAAGTELQLGARCGVSGLWTDTQWPDDYVVSIPAGSTALMTMDVPFELDCGATYTVSLEYIVDPEGKAALGREVFPVPEQAMRGCVVSEPLVLAWEKDERYDAFVHAAYRFKVWEVNSSVEPDKIVEAERVALEALAALAGDAPSTRDQQSLERAQRVMAIVSFVGLPLSWLRAALGEPTTQNAGDIEYVFESGVGWRVRVENDRITSVVELWPPPPTP